MTHINIEIKARCNNHSKIKKILKSQNAVYQGKDHQIDTYFLSNSGRLKLREGQIENCLIYYKRQNIEGPKKSNCILYMTSPKSSLKQLLVDALGILVVVDKERDIYFIDNIKFHLDKVKKLGTFVEIEVRGEEDAKKEKLLEQCQYYLKLFNISSEDLVSTSYSDILMETKRKTG